MSMYKPAFSAHARETLWIGFLFMALLYAAMTRLTGIEGNAGLYGKLADAFLSGHTYLAEKPPQHLLDSPNPYAIARGSPDMRYSDYLLYEGRFYLPYGPVPALLIFAPYKLLTGHDLSLEFVVFAFAGAGTAILIFLYLKLARLLDSENDRRFRLVTFLLIAGTFIPIALSLPSHYQVALTGAYCFTALALWFLLDALEPPRRLWLLALSGLCLGLAAGCRLNFAFAGVGIIGLLKLYWLRRSHWRFSREYFAKALAIGLPWLLSMLGLLYYNDVRFHSPLDTGIAYQLMWKSLKGGDFSLARIWANFYFFFLKPIPLSWSFPFFHPAQCCRDAVTVPWPTAVDLSTQEPVYGAFANAPFLLFCFVTPFMLRRAPSNAALLMLSCWIVAIAVLPVLLLLNSTMRYLVDFTPWLMLCACLGYNYWMEIHPHSRLKWLARFAAFYTLAANLAYGMEGFMKVTYS